MIIRMIDCKNEDNQINFFVTREPRPKERIYLKDGHEAFVRYIYQLVRDSQESSMKEPDFVAIVEYQDNGNPVLKDWGKETEQRLMDWFNGGNDDENL